MVGEFYPDYPDPLPAFSYLGGEHGIGLLESALAEPQQTFQGKYLRRTIFDKAASLFRSLIKNHPLIDGNKRLALSAVTIFLIINGYAFYVPHDEAVSMALRVASRGPEPTVRELSLWFRRNSFKFRGASERYPPSERYPSSELEQEVNSLLDRLAERMLAEAKRQLAF